MTEHFGEANPLSFFFGEDILASGSTGASLFEVRNQFWRRTLNNLPYLLKTKGKRNNLDAFFNVLGINRANINLKEYGYLPGGSIQDTRIHKDRPTPLLGIGTGSLSASFVKVTSSLGLIPSDLSEYTIETLLQAPFTSASYTASVDPGAIWQFQNPTDNHAITLFWDITDLTENEGKFVLSSSDGPSFSSSVVEVFDGDFVHVAAGLKPGSVPFIGIRTLDNDELDQKIEEIL